MSTQVEQPSARPTTPVSGVQSLHRALDVLEALGEAGATGGGRSVAAIAEATGLPAPTAHRLVRTLVERGYVRQLADRRYSLGFRLVPLGASAQQQVGSDARAVLSELVSQLGETANLAVLTGHQAEYVAQVPSQYSMRMFTEVGRRVDLHSTGVGKALLAQLDDAAVADVVAHAGLGRVTEHTVTTPAGLARALDAVRRQGYAVDEQEQELGVRCVAVAIDPPTLGMAVSVSGPLTRVDDALVARAVPLLQDAARRLARALDPTTT